jgi:hypothetical protein
MCWAKRTLLLFGQLKLRPVQVFRPDSQSQTARRFGGPNLMMGSIPDRRPSCTEHFN